MDTGTYLSVNFAIPIQWQEISYGDGFYETDMEARTASLGLGVDFTTFLTRRVGIHVSADFFFPQTMDATYTYAGISQSERYKLQDEWDSDWGISVFVGPSFALLRTPRILFALAPGLHYYMLFAESGSYSAFQYAVGLGANAELMFNLTRALFLRVAVDVAYDFWGVEERSDYYYPGTEYVDNDNTITVVPQVGIGIRL